MNEHVTDLPTLGQEHSRGRCRSAGGGQDWLRSWMPPVHIELWAGRFKQEGRDLLCFSALGLSLIHI